MLDRNYFNNLELDPVKGKYYPVDRVDDILVDIRRQALEMNSEIEKLRLQISENNKQKDEISEAVIAAKAACKEIIEKANLEAAEIVESTKSSIDIPSHSEEYYIQIISEMYSDMKADYEKTVEQMTSRWQRFLINLEDDVPEDLKSKVSSIAKEVRQMEKKNYRD